MNTSSEAFLAGSAGQPNYAAAKGGIVGLTTSTALALGKYGVTANAICPRARTRMTEDVFAGVEQPLETASTRSPPSMSPRSSAIWPRPPPPTSTASCSSCTAGWSPSSNGRGSPPSSTASRRPSRTTSWTRCPRPALRGAAGGGDVRGGGGAGAEARLRKTQNGPTRQQWAGPSAFRSTDVPSGRRLGPLALGAGLRWRPRGAVSPSCVETSPRCLPWPVALSWTSAACSWFVLASLIGWNSPRQHDLFYSRVSVTGDLGPGIQAATPTGTSSLQAVPMALAAGGPGVEWRGPRGAWDGLVRRAARTGSGVFRSRGRRFWGVSRRCRFRRMSRRGECADSPPVRLLPRPGRRHGAGLRRRWRAHLRHPARHGLRRVRQPQHPVRRPQAGARQPPLGRREMVHPPLRGPPHADPAARPARRRATPPRSSPASAPAPAGSRTASRRSPAAAGTPGSAPAGVLPSTPQPSRSWPGEGASERTISSPLSGRRAAAGRRCRRRSAAAATPRRRRSRSTTTALVRPPLSRSRASSRPVAVQPDPARAAAGQLGQLLGPEGARPPPATPPSERRPTARAYARSPPGAGGSSRSRVGLVRALDRAQGQLTGAGPGRVQQREGVPPGHQAVDEDPPVAHRLHLGARLLRLVAGQRHRVRLGAVQGPALREPGVAGRREACGVGTVRGERAGLGAARSPPPPPSSCPAEGSIAQAVIVRSPPVTNVVFACTDGESARPGFTHKGVPGTIRLRERGHLCWAGPQVADGGGGGSTPQIRRVALLPCPVCLKSSPRWRACGPPSGPSPGTRSAPSWATRTRRSPGSCSPSTRSRRSSTRR